MNTGLLRSFATSARTELIREVGARITAVLAQGSPERVEQLRAVAGLERAIARAGGGDNGKDHVADKVAYTWFNRVIALRFMDANGYTSIGVVSPAADQVGQPEVLAAAKRGQIDGDVLTGSGAATVTGLLDGTRTPRPGVAAQAEAYALLLAGYCRFWNRAMPFMFEREGDYTELLIPANFLAEDSVLSRSVRVLSEEVCRDVEVIGWLYQFYISERKDEVFAGFKKGMKAGADEIPAATQLFTPHWIVRYLVENSLGRLWMLNHPESRLVDRMEYYIAQVDEETDFLKISAPEELTVIDPACGSGHMLTYAFDLLYAIYEEEGYTPSQIPSLVLANNLYGTEIDPRAGALAAFALTMKAAARRKLFLKSPVEPNVSVLEPISFRPDELDYLVTKDGDQQAEGAFWNQFAKADTFGALIQPDPALTARLAGHLAVLSDDGDILRADALSWAQRVIKQAAYLTRDYGVVVANPPYMGGKQMNALLAQFMKDEYPDSKSDLFAGFVERCLNLLPIGGFGGFMTPFVWMFISSYTGLRQRLINQEAISSLIQLEYSGFDGATVPICTFTLHRGPSRARGAFVRLSDFVGPAVQGPKALEIIGDERAKREGVASNGMDRYFYRVDSRSFAAIPGSVIAYWLSEKMRATFNNAGFGGPLGNACGIGKGITTGNNGRFLRLWWEVSRGGSEFNRDHDSSTPTRTWQAADKGGDFRRWYGNNDWVIFWPDDGREIVEFPGSTPRNMHTRFRPSIACTKISSSGISFRAHDRGFVHTDASVAVTREGDLDSVLGFVNSSTANGIMAALAPTLNFEVGQIRSLPWLVDSHGGRTLANTVAQLKSNSAADWDSFEGSFDFAGNPLIALAIESVQPITAHRAD